MVLLAPEDPKNNEILFRRDQSDSDGTFDLANVFPGRYRLLAIENGWELEWANPAVLQAFLAKSVPLEVKSGDHLKQTVEVQSSLTPGGPFKPSVRLEWDDGSVLRPANDRDTYSNSA